MSALKNAPHRQGLPAHGRRKSSRRLDALTGSDVSSHIPLAAAQDARRHALGLLARARPQDLEQQLAELQPLPHFEWLRRPETGMLMLRGRLGGGGQVFNLGEATVTRCTLRLQAPGLPASVGVGTVRGSDPRHAELVALADALLQTPDWAPQLQARLLRPLAEAELDRHARRAAEVARSKVDFYTLVRGED